MTNFSTDISLLQQRARMRNEIGNAIIHLFASEDEGLRKALSVAREAGLPNMEISPIQGKLLQLLATACHARKILEIGSLAGYSGIWLARALPVDGHLITLEIDPKHAEIVRNSFAEAGVGHLAEVRVGVALDLLLQLESEAPFDMIFIDADKIAYPEYLDWALRLTRVGGIIVADNCVQSGDALQEPEQLKLDFERRILEGETPNEYEQIKNQVAVAVAIYNRRVANHPRLKSLTLAIDHDYMDGITIAVVLPEDM